MAQMARPAQPVRVTQVRFAAPKATRSFTGTVRPQHETVTAFRVPGKIVARLVEVGDVVVVGQVLARLDDTDARLSLASAEAEAMPRAPIWAVPKPGRRAAGTFSIRGI